jgi:2-enoate reductase
MQAAADLAERGRQVRLYERQARLGGRLVGMEIAVSLSKKGFEVSLITQNHLGENGRPLERNIFVTLQDILYRQGVKIYPHTSLMEVTTKGVYAASGSEFLFLETDSVVLAVGMREEDRLARELQGWNLLTYCVGDCHKVRDSRVAINEAAEIARQIGAG